MPGNGASRCNPGFGMPEAGCPGGIGRGTSFRPQGRYQGAVWCMIAAQSSTIPLYGENNAPGCVRGTEINDLLHDHGAYSTANAFFLLYDLRFTIYRSNSLKETCDETIEASNRITLASSNTITRDGRFFARFYPRSPISGFNCLITRVTSYR